MFASLQKAYRQTGLRDTALGLLDLAIRMLRRTREGDQFVFLQQGTESL